MEWYVHFSLRRTWNVIHVFVILRFYLSKTCRPDPRQIIRKWYNERIMTDSTKSVLLGYWVEFSPIYIYSDNDVCWHCWSVFCRDNWQAGQSTILISSDHVFSVNTWPSLAFISVSCYWPDNRLLIIKICCISHSFINGTEIVGLRWRKKNNLALE